MNREGKEVDNLFLYADHNLASGNSDSRKWVEENVIPTLGKTNCETLLELRNRFWNFYMNCKKKYSTSSTSLIIVADCGAPCEAGFFAACI